MTAITSTVKRLTNNFTRPANTTAYASGDLVADSTTAIDVIPIALSPGRGGFRIVGVRLETDRTTVTNATFRVHFFESQPTVANGDNGVFSVNNANYVGYVDMPTLTASTNGSYGVRHAGEASAYQGGTAHGLYGYASSTYIYALIEARAAYTPASGQSFTLTVTTEKF